MTKTIYQPNYWHYLTGDFLNRVHPRFRKAIKILMAVVIGALLLAGLYKLYGTPNPDPEGYGNVQLFRLRKEAC
mgnify:CR=1 FL=1